MAWKYYDILQRPFSNKLQNYPSYDDIYLTFPYYSERFHYTIFFYFCSTCVCWQNARKVSWNERWTIYIFRLFCVNIVCLFPCGNSISNFSLENSLFFGRFVWILYVFLRAGTQYLTSPLKTLSAFPVRSIPFSVTVTVRSPPLTFTVTGSPSLHSPLFTAAATAAQAPVPQA